MVIHERISPDKLNIAVNMLKVIAHPIRLAIVDLLTQEERLTVMDIQERLGIEQAIASQHLTLLQDKGVLNAEKVGRNKFVSLRYPKMMHIVQCIEGCCEVL